LSRRLFEANGKTVVKVKNPQLAFAKVLVMLDKERSTPLTAGIHPSSVISNKSAIGKNVHIGPFVAIEDGADIGGNSVIMANCYIGRNTKIGQNALVYPGVTLRENITIGKNAIIHSGAVIGSDGFGFIPQGGSIFKYPRLARLR